MWDSRGRGSGGSLRRRPGRGWRWKEGGGRWRRHGGIRLHSRRGGWWAGVEVSERDRDIDREIEIDRERDGEGGKNEGSERSEEKKQE